MSDGTTPDKASLIVMSGDMDKVMGAFIIANGAAAFDMKVTMFLPSGASRRSRRGTSPARASWGGCSAS